MTENNKYGRQINNINIKSNMKKTLTITFCGAPNVGKSTLLNTLINCKLAICSPKPQTTRFNIKGILTDNKTNTQLVLIDTPGIFKPKLSMLEKQIVKEAWQGLCGADLICLIIDGSVGLDKSALTILDKTKTNNVPVIGIINKSDLLNQEDKILLAEKMWNTGRFSDIFSLSAKKNKGCDELLKYFLSKAKIGNWMFDEDDITDKDNNFIASEFVREQLFLILEKEIPYMLSCETELFNQTEDGAEISVLVNVGKENHKKIILGKNGENIKKIIRKASRNIENLLQQKVKLRIFVRVDKRK